MESCGTEPTAGLECCHILMVRSGEYESKKEPPVAAGLACYLLGTPTGELMKPKPNFLREKFLGLEKFFQNFFEKSLYQENRSPGGLVVPSLRWEPRLQESCSPDTRIEISAIYSWSGSSDIPADTFFEKPSSLCRKKFAGLYWSGLVV
ncbi:hypothetical protein WN51_04507 [Melipona quadrifasciata]|uniref:Uncharacterized protein n=1 Tax=Melipona quadrifasciata TaxID=166423 RepID=A0A0N0BD61_9HYME|nr:hypothetical protein WN51_04507 [Melipona quadrifasciata]